MPSSRPSQALLQQAAKPKPQRRWRNPELILATQRTWHPTWQNRKRPKTQKTCRCPAGANRRYRHQCWLSTVLRQSRMVQRALAHRRAFMTMTRQMPSPSPLKRES